MKSLLVPMVAALALVGTVGGWVALPMLQSDQAASDSAASLELERARRLLYQYNPGIDFKSLLLSGLAESGVDVEAAEPAALVEALGDEFERQLDEAWKLYSPMDWGETPRAARKPSGQFSQQIRSGISDRKELTKLNRELLEQALRAVDQALASGAGASRQHDAALRLKSVILHQFGMRELVRAELARAEAMPLLADLIRIGTQIASAAPLQRLVAGSGIDEQIQQLRARLAEAEAKLAQDRTALAQTEAKIAELTPQIESARRSAEDARRRMEDARATGLVDGGAGYAELMRTMRTSLATAQALEFGNYVNASIDASGDYILGAYVSEGHTGSPAQSPGLRHFESKRAVQAARVDGGQKEVAELAADIARIESMRSSQAAAEARAAQESADLRARATKLLADISAIDADAMKIEDNAIKRFSDAAAAGRDAAQAAGRWVSEAQSRSRELSPESKARSGVAQRTKDDWIAGFALAHVADAQAGKARVYALRYRNNLEVQRELSAVAEAINAPADLRESLTAKAQQARRAGIEAANEAVKTLEDVHRSVDNHWSITAQAAGTIYLMTLLDEPSYLQQSLEAYRAAVKGREDKPFADRFLSRLKGLESRKP